LHYLDFFVLLEFHQLLLIFQN